MLAQCLYLISAALRVDGVLHLPGHDERAEDALESGALEPQHGGGHDGGDGGGTLVGREERELACSGAEAVQMVRRVRRVRRLRRLRRVQRVRWVQRMRRVWRVQRV